MVSEIGYNSGLLASQYTDNMNVKSVTKLLVTFSASFLCALLVAVAALEKGLLSPRGLGVFLALVCLGGFVFFVIAFAG